MEEVKGFPKIPIGRAKDLSGQQFNRLKVLYRTQNQGKKPMWVCQCQCDKHTILVVAANHLKDGHTKSCGCLKTENKAGGRPIKDLSNQTFGDWKILKFDQIKNEHAYWLCECSCGAIKSILGSSLISGASVSCGHESKKIIDLTNQKFGKLTVLYKTKERKRGRVIWHCQCDCGNQCDVSAAYLLSGATKSCGCLGMSYGEYNISEFLIKNNINFIAQKSFKELKSINNYPMYFDFFVDNFYIIEYDGEQHFKYHFGNTWNNKQNFEVTRHNDLLKNKYCFEHNIPLIRIPYNKEYTFEDLKLETTRFLLTPENEQAYYESRK